MVMKSLAGVVAALALVGCAPTSKPLLLEGKANVDLEKKWEKYGAYYLVDELFVESSYLSSPYVSGPANKYIINKKLKILTTEGTKFGTVEIPVYSESTAVFRITHWDSTGKLVSFSTGPVHSAFLKKGKIVFPNVLPGSVLEMYIEFRNSSAVLTLEHWFSGVLPVSKGRFTFSYLDMYKYDFKPYGPLKEGVTNRTDNLKNLTYKSWEITEALPRSRIDFQDDIDVTEPRLSLAIRKFNSQEVFKYWYKISEEYDKYAMTGSYTRRLTKLRKLVDSLKQGKSTDLDKATTAFGWVQKNILFKPDKVRSIVPDKVIASGQGNMWEIAVVMREMFKYLGLESDVLVTRPRSYGGFDSSFVSPIQLAVTLVTVKIGKTSYLAFPWTTGAALGEYPLDYFGLQALSMSNKKIVLLPDFSGVRAYYRNELRINPNEENSQTQMNLESGGYLAFAIRNSLMGQNAKDIEEAYQKNLTVLGRSNALLKCEVQGIEKTGAPVKAKLVFSNPNQIVMHKGQIQLRLSHIFLPFFSSYDTTRSSGFKNHLDIDYSETLRVPKIPGKFLTSSIYCRNISNALFQLSCASEDTPEEFVFKRTVTVNRKKFNTAEIYALASDIQELNQIRESSLNWKSEVVTAPMASPLKKKK
jgi:hypothetical protein